MHREKDASTREYNLGGREKLSNRCLHEMPNRSINTYHANPLTKRRRKRVQHVDRWAKPPLHSLIAVMRSPELVDLVLEYSHESSGRVACFQLCGERMSCKILFCLFCICFEGFIKNGIEVGRGCRSHRGLEHRARSGRLTHA